MRVWLAAAVNRSTSGDQIWRQRVVAGTFQHTPALRLSFAQSMVRVLVEQNGIQFPASGITIPEERANRYLVRILKGLLTHFYPDFDYSAHRFKVDHLMPRPDDIAMLFSRFAYAERGEGVFRVFYGT